MPIKETQVLVVSIDAPFAAVCDDLANPMTHHLWAHRFFGGPSVSVDQYEVIANVPMMGGETRYRVDALPELGIFDLFLASLGQEFGNALPVRVIRNGDGADVLWTLTRAPGMPDEAWAGAQMAMNEELLALKERHERAATVKPGASAS